MRTTAFVGAILGAIAGGAVGTVLGIAYARREGSPIKREQVEGASLLSGILLGSGIGGAIGAGSCTTTTTG